MTEGNTKNFYLLTRKNCDYDENRAMVILATSPTAARVIAADAVRRTHCEPPDEWTDDSRSTCERLSTDDEEGIVLADFNAG